MNTKEKPVKDPANLAGSIREARILYGLSPFPCKILKGGKQNYTPATISDSEKRPD